MRKKPFKNTVGKGENAAYQHFFLFLQCFLPYEDTFNALTYI